MIDRKKMIPKQLYLDLFEEKEEKEEKEKYEAPKSNDEAKKKDNEALNKDEGTQATKCQNTETQN